MLHQQHVILTPEIWQEEITMAQKIYVGNMSYGTTEDTLSQIFSEYGEVLSVAIIKDRYTDQSKGFGFVEMADEAAAEQAIQTLNGSELDGRRVRVNPAEDKPRRQRPRQFNRDDRY